MKGTLVSRTVSGAVFCILFGHQSLHLPLWAQPFCDSLIVRFRPCTGWDWIVLDRSIYPFVLASKKLELVDAARDLVRCGRREDQLAGHRRCRWLCRHPRFPTAWRNRLDLKMLAAIDSEWLVRRARGMLGGVKDAHASVGALPVGSNSNRRTGY